MKQVKCLKCNKMYGEGRSLTVHLKSCKGIIEKFCLECGKLIPVSNKFCNSTCSAYYNNRNSDKLKECKRGPESKIILERFEDCQCCGKKLKPTSRIYCNQTCASRYVYITNVNMWLEGKIESSNKTGPRYFVKRWLIETFGNKCSICGWAEVHPVTGNVPVELDHLDGDSYNNIPENIRLLCPNCHSLTHNYKALNKGNGNKYYRKIMRERYHRKHKG